MDMQQKVTQQEKSCCFHTIEQQKQIELSEAQVKEQQKQIELLQIQVKALLVAKK